MRLPGRGAPSPAGASPTGAVHGQEGGCPGPAPGSPGGPSGSLTLRRAGNPWTVSPRSVGASSGAAGSPAGRGGRGDPEQSRWPPAGEVWPQRGPHPRRRAPGPPTAWGVVLLQGPGPGWGPRGARGLGPNVTPGPAPPWTCTRLGNIHVVSGQVQERGSAPTPQAYSPPVPPRPAASHGPSCGLQLSALKADGGAAGAAGRSPAEGGSPVCRLPPHSGIQLVPLNLSWGLSDHCQTLTWGVSWGAGAHCLLPGGRGGRGLRSSWGGCGGR